MGMDHKPRYSAAEAFEYLAEGNRSFLEEGYNGDHSKELMERLAEEGQQPYAVVITCSDSRVVPEIIFSAWLGDLFVIRTAGNTVDDYCLGSIEYAVVHLGCRLVVVLGHTQCGAVAATISGVREKHICNITDRIRSAIGDEKDPDKACELSIKSTLHQIENDLTERHDVRYVGGIYDIVTGKVDFFEDLHEDS